MKVISMGLNPRETKDWKKVKYDVVLNGVELDERSMKYMHQVLVQNEGCIRKPWYCKDDE